MTSGNTKRVIPFLRWAGGKTWLLKKFDQFLPHDFENYYEPFLGSGAVFFHLKQLGLLNGAVVLSDLNKELVDCFIQIRDNAEAVIDHLSTYQNEREFYYRMRQISSSAEEEKAARFIYLNRTSFNGVYRVNLNGVYNVPYGFKKYKVLFDFENLREASILLKGVEIVHRDFQHCAKLVRGKDLIFLDPPYTVAHENNGFVKYNQKIFAWEDQKRLAKTVKAIVDKDAYFVLTNAAHPNIDALFAPLGAKAELKRFSVIGGKKAKREIKSEYVFSNSNHGSEVLNYE